MRCSHCSSSLPLSWAPFVLGSAALFEKETLDHVNHFHWWVKGLLIIFGSPFHMQSIRPSTATTTTTLGSPYSVSLAAPMGVGQKKYPILAWFLSSWSGCLFGCNKNWQGLIFIRWASSREEIMVSLMPRKVRVELLGGSNSLGHSSDETWGRLMQ